VHRLADALAEGLRRAGLPPVHATRVDTVTVAYPTEREADAAVARAADAGLLLRRVDATRVGASLDETCDEGVVAAVLAALTGRTDGADPVALAAGAPDGIPAGARRDEPFLRQATFRRYRTEHEMLRYLRRLADRDLALDRTMIPLGSCTMKLNATTEMLAVTWPEFADLHPYAPAEDQRGSERLVQELESMLVAVTGYDAVSLQPNAGSQGELAGLLAIRAYHRSRHEEGRTVCLIPSSAHGTNAASAVMAGLRVVVVACDPHGNVDVDDLRAKCEAAGDALAALMVTYPSTHGVFEERIGEICELVHRHGGQVYVDGANLNALVGLARPGAFGADVSHLNLHKTFCIPHGGGGPGVGPVAVREHLAKFLPAHPLESAAAADEGRVGAVSAAPWGSAGILPISWAYVTLMGGEGLRAATEHAILAANYVAERLHARYPVLYRGERGRVAHECILDLRPIAARTGVTNDDVAKRLMDFGFHAPTMSFPVAGTLMVEPTESETIEELDRFCDAMLAIADEIDAIERGDIAVDDSPLRHAPHPVEDLVRGWDRRYSPETAAYPVPSLRSRGYFPPVSRIDAAAGDRTLVCACDPISAYAAGG
jgi:glycine dehydrogenase